MKRLFPVLALVLIVGCSSTPDLTESEQLSIKNLRTGKYTLIANDELATLKYNADLGRSVGRYSVHREGDNRTWRLDSATGLTCLLLASDSDWNKPEVKRLGCFYGGQ